MVLQGATYIFLTKLEKEKYNTCIKIKRLALSFHTSFTYLKVESHDWDGAGKQLVDYSCPPIPVLRDSISM